MSDKTDKTNEPTGQTEQATDRPQTVRGLTLAERAREINANRSRTMPEQMKIDQATQAALAEAQARVVEMLREELNGQFGLSVNFLPPDHTGLIAWISMNDAYVANVTIRVSTENILENGHHRILFLLNTPYKTEITTNKREQFREDLAAWLVATGLVK